MNENVSRLRTITADLSNVVSLFKPAEDLLPNPLDSLVASHRMTTSFSSSKQTVIGRDSERDQIIKSLLLPTPTSVSMIPIVGMGGIGKTTLAKMVYNHEEIKRHFDSRIWVCVSDNFEVGRLTREILEDLGADGFDHTTNVHTLKELLTEKLQSKRYLLVLDDVWNDSEEEKWGSLCAPLQSQNGGSRILMTTRLNTVVSIAAKNMDMLDQCQLEGLLEEKYLSLFNICAFGDDEKRRNHPSLEIIGKQIAARLKGSPLAAKSVGGLLREDLDEDRWRTVLCSDIWQLPQIHDDDIMPVLQLSYQHLAPSLQQCFIYCGIFPKDHLFDKDELVDMWISSGYIRTKSRGNKSVEEIGSEYFDNLLSRSFIQASDEEKEYVLHDLLHDLAESVSDNEHLKINPGVVKEITSSVRHLYVSVRHWYVDSKSFLKNCNLRNLRTLVIEGIILDEFDNVLKEVLNGLRSIHVLSITAYSKGFVGNIGHLIHLRHLTVCNQIILIDSQWRPYHLQWLIIDDYFIKEGYYMDLPAYTKYLVSLRHFPFQSFEDNEWREVFRMFRIGKLTCLQEFKYFLVEKTEGSKLAELKRLNELKGTLRLRSLHNASTKEEALEANLNKKVGIRKLVLDCNCGHATAQMAEEVFEGLCPPPYIEKLTLNVYRGVKSPTWMMMIENSCLLFLQSLKLLDCRNWKVLPPLGQLPLLRHLWISNADAVEEIGSSFYGSGVVKSFPCLETLKFEDMPEWVVWSGVEKDTDSLFPRLRELTVMNSPKLKGVPMQCLASVEALKTSCMLLLGEPENLTSLNKLILSKCGEEHSLTLSLVTLGIDYCDQLQSLFTTQTELPSLRKITISKCDKLVSVELKSLPHLKELRLFWCKEIQSVPVLPATLVELDIKGCDMLIAFSGEQEENLSDLTSLRKISICGCPELRSLPPMPASLQDLTLYDCSQLHSLPPMPASLKELMICDCPELPRERYQEGGDDWHKISHVPRIEWCEGLPLSLKSL